MSCPSVCYVTFPNSPTKFSGRGLDRYAYELIRGACEESKLGVQVVAPRTSRTNYVSREVETALRLRQIQAKIYHATSEYGVGCLLLARKKPIVVTIHDLIPQLFFKHSPIVYTNQLLHQNLARYANRVIATSQFYSRFLRKSLRIPQDRIDVVRYGVDHEAFKPSSNRKKNEISRVLYLGGLSSLKAANDVINAFATLCRSMEARLIVGGRGAQSNVLKKLSDMMRIREKVSFLGYVDEHSLAELYNSVDVLVWPSYSGFGLSTLEAMSCGTPVIAANCLDSEEYLAGSALLYPPGNVGQLGIALCSILSEQDSWRDWSDQAMKRSENFSWNKMAKEVCNAYENIR